MEVRYRVFGAHPIEPAPAPLLEHLQGIQPELTGNFSGDADGWFRAELTYHPKEPPLVIDRFLASEEGIRDELNTWAAWVEVTGEGPIQHRLMRHLIGTAQVFTMSGTGTDGSRSICESACRFLAQSTAGIYQTDGRGFFDAHGTLQLGAAD
jgi:hypothetical protein